MHFPRKLVTIVHFRTWNLTPAYSDTQVYWFLGIWATPYFACNWNPREFRYECIIVQGIGICCSLMRAGSENHGNRVISIILCQNIFHIFSTWRSSESWLPPLVNPWVPIQVVHEGKCAATIVALVWNSVNKFVSPQRSMSRICAPGH